MSLDMETKFKLKNLEGNNVEVPFHAQEYDAAAQDGISLSQYLTREHGDKTDQAKYGSVIGQFMASAGMYMGEDVNTGLKPPTMKAMSSNAIQVSAITRNDGSDRHGPSGRMLFPEIIMRTIESELRESQDDFLGGWEKMVAQTVSINSPKFDQPIINVKAPEASESNAISQLAEPDAMVSITVSDISRSIPTKSIGLLISDQAQQATTLDLVTLAMTAQARGERIRMVTEHIKGIVTGDLDRGETALTSFKANTLDSGITSAGEMSHKGYVKYLRKNYRKRAIDSIICDLEGAWSLNERTGKPTRDSVHITGDNISQDLTIENLIGKDPRVLILDDGILAANTIVGFDSRYAIRRVINVNSQYSAIEQFLMRRATGFRVDYGEIAHKLYTDAFDVMTLTI